MRAERLSIDEVGEGRVDFILINNPWTYQGPWPQWCYTDPPVCSAMRTDYHNASEGWSNPLPRPAYALTDITINYQRRRLTCGARWPMYLIMALPFYFHIWGPWPGVRSLTLHTMSSVTTTHQHNGRIIFSNCNASGLQNALGAFLLTVVPALHANVGVPPHRCWYEQQSALEIHSYSTCIQSFRGLS